MLRRYRLKSLLAIVVIVALAFTTLAIQRIDLFGFERGSDDVLGLQLGLDLAGGVHLVYETEAAQPTQDEMEGLIGTINRRVNSLGVTEPNVQQLGDNRVVVQLPGVQDADEARELIGRTARLEIIERVCVENTACQEPGEFEDRQTGLTGADMSRAYPGQDPTTGRPILLFELNPGAAGRFAEVTQRINSNGDLLAFVLDGNTLVAATVDGAILSGTGQIQGDFQFEEVRNLSIQVQSGVLPLEVSEISSTVVAGTLGARSLENAMLAGAVGLLLVMFFMTAYYRASGLVASLALVFYTAILLAIFKLIPVTLTLAGVAGIILSLGMAVDANVLIFERMKEELRNGRTLQFSLQLGFNRAWAAIRDGNVATLIIAGILYLFGSGAANYAVVGFAVTLAIGTVLSMFSAITISRTLLAILVASPLRRYPLFSPESAPKRTTTTQALAPERGV